MFHEALLKMNWTIFELHVYDDNNKNEWMNKAIISVFQYEHKLMSGCTVYTFAPSKCALQIDSYSVLISQ